MRKLNIKRVKARAVKLIERRLPRDFPWTLRGRIIMSRSSVAKGYKVVSDMPVKVKENKCDVL